VSSKNRVISEALSALQVYNRRLIVILKAREIFKESLLQDRLHDFSPGKDFLDAGDQLVTWGATWWAYFRRRPELGGYWVGCNLGTVSLRSDGGARLAEPSLLVARTITLALTASNQTGLTRNAVAPIEWWQT